MSIHSFQTARPSRFTFASIAASLSMLVSLSAAPPAHAEANAAAVDEMAGYLDFVEYHGGVMFVEQIPAEEWKRFVVIDTRDAGQFTKEHIPGAINLEWRKVLAERTSIPKDKPVLLYCNTGTLSAQAGFALRVAGYENVRILQGGFEAWKAANQKKAGS